MSQMTTTTASTTSITPPPAPSASEKSGFESTEFWQSMLVTILGVVICVYGLVRSDTALMNTGLFVAGGSSGVYTVGRSVVKGMKK